MLNAPSTASSTFALSGPKTYTFETLLSLVEALTLKKLQGPNFPKPILALAARLWDFAWWRTLSPDEVVRRFIDDVRVEGGLKGFEELGIEPDVLEDVAIVYLRRYRSRLVSFFFRVGLYLLSSLFMMRGMRLEFVNWSDQMIC